MKKIIILITAAFLMVLFSACFRQVENQNAASIASSEKDETDLLSLGEQYLNPVFYAGITNNSWDSDSEINADKLVAFYVWAGRHKSFDFAIPENLDTNEYNDAFVPANIVESEVKRYFYVSSEHMRDSEYYNAETNTYMIFGLGGVNSCEIVNVISSDNIVEIDFIGYQDGALYQTGKLSIKLDGDAYKYYSCHVENEASSNNYVSSIVLLTDEELEDRLLYLLDSHILPVFWWTGASDSTLDINYREDIEPLENTPENTEFYQVMRFYSIKEMKRATEQVVTKAYANKYLYPFLEKTNMFIERDGKLYRNQSMHPYGVAPYVPISATVLSKDENKAVLSLILRETYGKELVREIEMQRETGIWKLNNCPYMDE